MSWFSDLFGGVEEVLKGTVLNAPLGNVETVAVKDVGAAAQDVVVGAIGKALPGTQALTREVTDPLLAAVEALVLHYLSNVTATLPTKPDAPEAPPPTT